MPDETGLNTSAGTAQSIPTTPNLGGGTGAGGVSDTGGAGSGGPIDLSDDTLVRVKGQAEPVKYGELSKRQQADYTRKTQQTAQLQAQVVRERQQLGAERARLETIAATLASRQQGDQGGQVDPFVAELGGAEFIDGKTAVKMLQAIQQRGLAPIASAIQEREDRKSVV